jgi:hypothetical protein
MKILISDVHLCRLQERSMCFGQLQGHKSSKKQNSSCSQHGDRAACTHQVAERHSSEYPAQPVSCAHESTSSCSVGKNSMRYLVCICRDDCTYCEVHGNVRSICVHPTMCKILCDALVQYRMRLSVYKAIPDTECT